MTKPETTLPEDVPMIITRHFHGKPMPLTAVLSALASQEGNDGDEGAAMQAARDYVERLARDLARADAVIDNFARRGDYWKGYAASPEAVAAIERHAARQAEGER
jgi:hypothetical protein